MSANVSRVGKEIYEFGPFRVDAEKEMLVRGGEPVALTPKTFQILLVLLRHSREVVSKDDLMKTVWPDTFVEESNLTRCVSMLRKALGDTSQDRYIITVPGRGYRLAEEVRVISESDITVVAATLSTVQIDVKEKGRPLLWIAGVAAALVLVIAALWLALHRRAVVGEKDTVVLADFNNMTGESVFDETLRQGMAIQLAQSPYLTVVSDARVKRTLTFMGQPAGVRLTPELAAEVCQRAGSAIVLEGSIARLGSEYVVGLRAKNCGSGGIVFEEQLQAHKKEDVLDAVGKLASKFRTQAGESVATVAKYDVPLTEATTPSLDALKAYSMGFKLLHSTGSAAAIPFFTKATELDPNFAMAHAFLGRMYGDLGQFDLSAASTRRAYDLRSHASDRERFFIAASYDEQVTGNLQKAQQTCEAWAEAYPRDPIPLDMLAGIIAPTMGRYEQNIKHAEKAVEIDPDFGVSYAVLAYDYVSTGRYSDAEAVIRRAAARKLAREDFAVIQYDLAFLENNEVAMQQQLELGKQDPGTEAWITVHRAFVSAFHGRLREATETAERASASMQQSGELERAAQASAATAIWHALFGDAAGARRSAEDAMRLSHDRDVEYAAALSFALTGNLPKAESIANDLESRFAEDTSAKFSYLPVLRAAVALHESDPAKAIEELRVAADYDLGCPRSCQHGFYGAMYPVYLRGEAYLALHQGNEAAAEFQKIIDHPGIVISDPVAALAYLQQGRAYALAGETAKAKSSYDHFLKLWNNADAQLPVLIQAKVEYAKLR